MLTMVGFVACSEKKTLDGHEYVDLGLSVKWATCNIGASSPEDYGDYFAWGEVSPKSEYTEENCITSGKCIDDIAGDSLYDAARANWGGSWRLPTMSELEELVDKCTCTWTIMNGKSGCKVTGPNGNSIFFPAAGGWFGTSPYFVARGGETSSLEFAGENGYYWCATPRRGNIRYANKLFFNRNGCDVGWIRRDCGYPVRPVSE